ncbi:MAG: hypothetical protein IAX21_01910 [Candidatus Bathyarchaeota archaeon]|nr:MAG: hypothetical protein IAX21_01910 [Candidatus Bathyarchaeota archaeon]
MSEVDSETYAVKKKPVFHTQTVVNNLSDTNGFLQRKEHNDEVQRLLEKSCDAIILDVKLNKPARSHTSNVR